jgi:DNA-binding SARP family transcriptional activator/predicted ATPase
MTTLTLRCLGPLEIILDETPLTRFATQKERALLVYLACHADHPLTRETLQTLLWGESDSEHAARSLRQALVQLRRALPPAFLTSARLTVTFHAGPDCFLDVVAFAQDPPPLALYRGPFLQGLDVRVAPAWEEWVARQREHLQTRALLAWENTGAQHARRGEYPQAVTCYQHALALDPWRETSHQALMRGYALTGDRAAALAQYKKCRLALHNGLNVPPLPETVALYQRLRAGETAEDSLPAETPPALPFTGRAAPHAALITAWDTARRGQGRRPQAVTFVEGEAGLGKTRLVEEVLRQVALQGGTVARGRALEFAAEIPYRPFLDVLRTLIPRTRPALAPVWLAALAPLHPELYEQFPTLPAHHPPPDETARARLFEAVARLLHTPDHPVVLFLDDLHWADLATLDLLHHLGHEAARGRVWLVCTYRPEETPPAHPLTRVRQALTRAGLAQHVQLPPLEPHDVQTLAAWVSDDPRLAAFLGRESGGSPFVLGEIVRTLQETGQLLLTAHGKWTLTGDLAGTLLAARVEDLTLQRVARLPEPARGWLDFAAIIGERFSPVFLAEVVGEPLAALTPCLQLWQTSRLLIPDAQGRLGFTHDKIQAAILHALPPSTRKLIHERIGQTMVDHADLAGLAALTQAAYHFEHSLAPQRAVPFLDRAIEAARQMCAPQQALEYAQRLLPLSQGALRVETLLRLGALHKQLAHPAETCAAFEQARQHAETLGRADLLARALSGLGMEIAGRGDYAASVAYLTHAIRVARVAQAPAVLVETLYHAGWAHHRAGQNQLALAASEEAQALCAACEGETTSACVLSLRLLCSIQIQLGQYARARQDAERLLADDQQHGRQEGVCRSLNTLGEIARLRGDFATAQAHYRASLALAEEILPTARYARRSNLAGARVGAGEYAAAETELCALAALPEVAAWPLLGEILRFLAEAYLGQGKLDAAWDAAQEALALAQKATMADVAVAAWRVLGQLAAQGSAAAGGEGYFKEGLVLCEQAGLEGERAWTLRAWGLALLQQGAWARGTQVLAEAQTLFTRLEMCWPVGGDIGG